MKKKIKVLVVIELDHGKKMTKDKANKIAMDTVYGGSITGCSYDFGSYFTKQFSKKVVP